MSAFLGMVRLSGAGSPSFNLPIILPAIADEPFLERETRHADAASCLHHRLRIITPEDRGERQPWPAWGGAGWVAFAGYLTGRDALAAALDLPTAAGTPDGRLAALTLERWGADGPARLNGDFAVAAWHGGERRLILAGDPLGNRGVFHARDGDTVWFSSAIRPLLAVPGISRAVDEETIADLLAMNHYDSDRTVFRAVRKVPAAGAVVLTAAKTENVTFHRFDPERRIHLRRDEDYVDAAWELLDRAVADRLRAVGPMPISGSGGLDSACLAVSAARAGRPVPFLTAVPDPDLPSYAPPGLYADERERVEALAAAVPGLEPVFLPGRFDADWSPDAATALAAAAAPTLRPSQITWFTPISRHAAALGARACLTGGIGNHTLTWSGHRLPIQLLLQGRWWALARELLVGGRFRPRGVASLIRHEILPYLRRPRFDMAALAGFSCLSEEGRRRNRVFERMAEHGNDPQWLFHRDDRRQRIHLIHRNRAHRAEGVAMLRALHGVDYLTPIGDLRLMEFCLAIPEEQFRRNGERRSLARRMLRQAGAPPIITDDETRGLQNPEWFAVLSRARDDFPGLIARLRRNATVGRLIDLDRVERIAADWPADAAAAHRQASLLRAGLANALNIGAFITWAEGTN